MGHGKDILVWTDPWVLGLPNFKAVSCDSAVIDKALKVQDLISNGAQDLQPILSTASTITINQIQKIRIPLYPSSDVVVQTRANNGKYTAKLGYQLEYDQHHPVILADPGSSTEFPKTLQRHVWNLNIHPKAKHFM